MYDYLWKLFLTGCLVAAGLLLVVGCTPAETSAGQPAEEAAANLEVERVEAASVARWEAMGEFYSQLAENEHQAALEEGVAGWVTMDEFYAITNAGEAANWQPVSADTAHWQGVADTCPDFGRLDYNYACQNGGQPPTD